jgi:putative SOS response-associated peptidase YedK
MCGRYYIDIAEKNLRDIIVAAAGQHVAGRERVGIFRGGEIFPSNIAPVLTDDRGTVFMSWGFPNLLGKRPHINARSETASTSKTFREAMDGCRCLVPATSYFEWKKLGPKLKQKHEFKLPGSSPLYMAGIFSLDGKFAILTREAAPAIAEIHDRMPVILPKGLTTVWLKESTSVLGEALTDLLFEPVVEGRGQLAAWA